MPKKEVPMTTTKIRPSFWLSLPKPLVVPSQATTLPKNRVHWSWVCRAIDSYQTYWLGQETTLEPRPGDVAVVRIEATGLMNKLVTTDGEQVRLFPNDLVVCAFGHHKALAGCDAEVVGVDDLHLVSKGGMVGTLQTNNRRLLQPTRLTFLGYLVDAKGQRLNLKEILFQPKTLSGLTKQILPVVGTGPDSDKSSVVIELVEGLLALGMRVAVCRLLGSVSHQALRDLWATAAHHVSDFSDYGFPSTYLCDEQELLALFYTMVADAMRTNPDIIVLELTEGIPQRENQLLLSMPEVQHQVHSIVLAAASVRAAQQALRELQPFRCKVIAIGGPIIHSPALLCESPTAGFLPIASSVVVWHGLAQFVVQQLKSEL
jgi:hypothetical protein